MNLIISLLPIIVVSGCASSADNFVPEIETLSGTWVMTFSKRVYRSIEFKEKGSCTIHQKEPYESLFFLCRYEKNGANVLIYHVHPIKGHDLTEIESLEYSATDEKLISFRDAVNQENNMEYIKIEE
jgi:hypothetical protein